MKIENYEDLITFSSQLYEKKARKILLDCYQIAVNSVDPHNIIRANLTYNPYDNVLSIKNDDYFINSRKIWVIGAGKAVGGMAEALEEIFDGLDYEGIVCIPQKLKDKLNLKKILCLESTHPLPSEINLKNTKILLDFIKRIKPEDLVISLISGGGSAMWTAPHPPITIKDLVALNEKIIKSGMSIHQINTIRKHISEIKGGKLAEKISSEVIVLILSDVIGDNLDIIASGPLFPDPSTFFATKSILKKYKLWGKEIPNSVMSVIQKGCKEEIPETLKPGDRAIEKIHSYIIGSNQIACKAILSHAKKIGLDSLFLTDKVEGDARWFGKLYARLLSGLSEEIKNPLLIVSGGEPTIEVQGDGIGGRNQEVVAALVNEFFYQKPDFNFTFISAGTDGIDGNSSFAGAMIDNQFLKIFYEKMINLDDFLSRSDVCRFFQEVGGALLQTGPTGTNVMDIHISIINTEKFNQVAKINKS